jgi:hypothetical protein
MRDVPARDGTPDAEQYERAVTDAVANFSQALPLHRFKPLVIVAGQSSYAMSADFYRFIRLVGSVAADGNVLVTSSGLVPLAPGSRERHTVAGKTLTITPTPAYGGERQLEYAAVHLLNESDEYPDLADDAVGVVLLKAKASALRLQAGKAAPAGWKYAIGDESVDKSNVSRAIFEDAQKAEDEYLRRVRELRGVATARGIS